MNELGKERKRERTHQSIFVAGTQMYTLFREVRAMRPVSHCSTVITEKGVSKGEMEGRREARTSVGLTAGTTEEDLVGAAATTCD